MSSDSTARPCDDTERGLAGAIFDDSVITDIQGERGELRHRGYAIEDLAIDPSFERTAYLLLHGEWPTTGQQIAFRADLASRRSLPVRTLRILGHLRDCRPDDALRCAVSSLDLGQHTGRPAMEIGLDLIAKIPSMIVSLHAHRSGRHLEDPDPTLDHAADFLRRLLGWMPSTTEEAMINLDFVLHADHGADGPSFAARVVASTGAGMAYAIMAAMAATAGPFDGGAILEADAVLADLEASAATAIGDDRTLPDHAVDQVAYRDTIYRHAAYRNRDPRCRLYRRALITLAREAGDARAVDLLSALSEALAPSRRMGIDVATALHAATLYNLLGLPRHLAISTFIAARSVGWVAQVLEQQRNDAPIRPRLRYVGPTPRHLPGRSRP